jgi:uncharacterized protein
LHWYLIVGVVVAGFAAGFINTVAGSGSLLTLPVLIYLGLPPTVANGTNRVGVLLQNLVSTASFRQQKVLDLRQGIAPIIPAVVGWLAGAVLAANLDQTMMKRAIAVLMLVMLIVMLVKPERWLRGHAESFTLHVGAREAVIFFFIGIYGGFIQAGVGVFILAALVLGVGMDLVHANGLKVLVILAGTAAALLVFQRNGQVNWGIGLILAAGQALGALAASRMSVKRGAPFIRWFLIAVILISSLDMLGARDWIGRLF